MIKFKETRLALPNKDTCGEFKDRKLLHVCEACGRSEILTPEEGYKQGWDAAPYMYPFKMIAPRTCSECSIEKTVWFDITINHKTYEELSDIQKRTVTRIYKEPEILLVEE